MSTMRPAGPDDAETIARIHVAAWRWAYRGLLPDALLDGLDVAERAARRREALENPGRRRAWVVEDEGEPCGFLITGPTRDEDLATDPPTWEVYALYLEPGRVGRGLGRALLQRALADAAEAGSREIVLWVLEGNERGRGFYRAAGFRDDERCTRRACIQDEGTARRMRLALAEDPR